MNVRKHIFLIVLGTEIPSHSKVSVMNSNESKFTLSFLWKVSMSKNVSLQQTCERMDGVKKDPTEGEQHWVGLVHLTIVYWSSFAMIPERERTSVHVLVASPCFSRLRPIGLVMSADADSQSFAQRLTC